MCIISSMCVVQVWSAKRWNIDTVLDLFSLFSTSSISPLSLPPFLPSLPSLPLSLPPCLPSSLPYSPPLPPPLQGLHVGDTIVEFGSVTSSNFTSLQEIATVVQHSNEVGVADHHGYCCHGYHYTQISRYILCVLTTARGV